MLVGTFPAIAASPHAIYRVACVLIHGYARLLQGSGEHPDAPEELAALAGAQRAEDWQLGGAEHALEARLKIGRVKGRQEPERAHRKGRQRRQRSVLPAPRPDHTSLTLNEVLV